MEQLIVAARDLIPGDYLPFIGGDDANLNNLSKLERIIVIGVDPLRDTVEVHTRVGGRVMVATGLPGSAVMTVYREEENDNETVD